MATSDLDLPPHGHFVESIRESCRACTGHARLLPAPEAVDRLLDSPYLSSSYDQLSVSHGTAFPLLFPNALAELNLLSLLSLLNFGSAYRIKLHVETGRGAYDNIRSLVLAMYLDDPESAIMSARGIQTITKEKVASLLQVSIHEETEHPTIPGMTVGELKGHMYDFVTAVTSVLNETGSILVEQHYADLGSFVAEALKEAEKQGKAKGHAPLADVVIESLVRAFPAFRDVYEIDGKPVYIFKKALFLVHALYLRYGEASNPPFPIPDTRDLPAFADNVVPSMLVHLGLIDLTPLADAAINHILGEVSVESLLALPVDDPEMKKHQVPEAGPSLTPIQVAVLRAAAVAACDDIVEAARRRGKSMTAVGLDGWLWSAAKKRADWRRLPRFVESEPGVFF